MGISEWSDHLLAFKADLLWFKNKNEHFIYIAIEMCSLIYVKTQLFCWIK